MEREHIIFSRKCRRAGVAAGDFLRNKGKQNLIIIGALLFLTLIFFLINNRFLDQYNIVSMMQSLAPYAIMGLGVTFVIATGGIDLSIGTVCIASAVVAGKLLAGPDGRVDPSAVWYCIPIMIAIGTVFGLLNGVLIAKLKMPPFIATLGTMLLARGLSAIIVSIPNVFYPSLTGFNAVFSNANGFPTGIVWVIGLMLVCMYLMYKNKIGRYILSIGSNEEATRLSGIKTDTYKMTAYIFSGLAAGIAAVFWAAAFPTVATATGNGMELDAIAGVYIGGTSAAGGVASVFGSVVGGLLLVVIRSGLNMALARFNLNVNATYVTYVLTGIIVVVAVLIDVFKNKRTARGGIGMSIKSTREHYRSLIELKRREQDVLLSSKDIEAGELAARNAELEQQMERLRKERDEKLSALKVRSDKA